MMSPLEVLDEEWLVGLDAVLRALLVLRVRIGGEGALVHGPLGVGPVAVEGLHQVDEEVFPAVGDEGAEERRDRLVEAELLPDEDRVQPPLAQPVVRLARAESVHEPIGRGVGGGSR